MAKKKQVFRHGNIKIIEMHPLEESALNLFHAYKELEDKLPNDMTAKEEMDLMIEKGADSVKQKRDYIVSQRLSLQPNIDKALKEYEDAHNKWVAHCEACFEKGLDPDTYIEPEIITEPTPEETV